MSDESTIINIGAFAEPLNTFINKVSEALGGTFKPHQIRRVAKAEADTRVISAKTDIEIAELIQRAETRFLAEEVRKQVYIEAITSKAFPHIKDNSRPQDVEDDWLVYFFDKARLISDDEMQNLWAKILAGEANLPGTFSRRTINFVSTIDKRDAEMFTALCKFCWYIDAFAPLIFYHNLKIYTDNGVSFATLEHLNKIGLVSFGTVDYYAKGDISEQIHYFGTPVMIEQRKDTDQGLIVGSVLLTQIGEEIAPLSGATPIPDFFEFVLERWMKQGLNPSSPYPRKR